MRILVTADPFLPVPPSDYGGIERIIFFLVEGLLKRGHEVSLACHRQSKTSATESHFKQYIFPWNHISNTLTIYQAAKEKPDVIHSFSRLAYLLPVLRTPTPKLMTYQREPTIKQIQRCISLAKESLSFTGCSNYITNQIKSFAPAFTVYNGVELSKYTFRNNVEKDAPLVFLGRIEPIKGTHNAVKAAQLTGRKLLIAGNIASEHKSYYDKQIRPHLSNRIEYIGPVNDVEKNKLLGSACSFLMPIEWNEPFGIVMAEAMACGTPVIGYPLGAVPEIVTNNFNGFLANDIGGMVEALRKIETIDRSNCRKTVEDRFSADKIIGNYLSVYHQIMKGA